MKMQKCASTVLLIMMIALGCGRTNQAGNSNNGSGGTGNDPPPKPLAEFIPAKAVCQLSHCVDLATNTLLGMVRPVRPVPPDKDFAWAPIPDGRGGQILNVGNFYCLSQGAVVYANVTAWDYGGTARVVDSRQFGDGTNYGMAIQITAPQATTTGTYAFVVDRSGTQSFKTWLDELP